MVRRVFFLRDGIGGGFFQQPGGRRCDDVLVLVNDFNPHGNCWIS